MYIKSQLQKLCCPAFWITLPQTAQYSCSWLKGPPPLCTHSAPVPADTVEISLTLKARKYRHMPISNTEAMAIIKRIAVGLCKHMLVPDANGVLPSPNGKWRDGQRLSLRTRTPCLSFRSRSLRCALASTRKGVFGRSVG